MCKYQLDHHRVLDTCNYLDGTTACVTGRYIDIEYSLEAFRSYHRCMTFCGCVVICCTNFLTLIVLAALYRCYQGTVIAVWRENTMESSQVNPGLRHQGSKPSHEIQWLEDNVGSAISIRHLQLVADVAV